MSAPFAARRYAEGTCGLYISPCLCEPPPPGHHACVYTSTLWVRRADGTWHRPWHKSMHKAAAWLALVEPGDSWADVCAVMDLPVGHDWHREGPHLWGCRRCGELVQQREKARDCVDGER